MKKLIWSTFLLVRNVLLRLRERIFKIPVMRVELDNQTIDMFGFNPVDPEVDEAFKIFYSSFYSDIDYSKLINDYLPRLYASIRMYFSRIYKVSDTQKNILNNLTPAWRTYIESNNLPFAQGIWQNVQCEIRNWEKIIGSRLHKGSNYYYWGGTALLQGELDRGFFLMHAAYEEDVETEKKDRPETPAFKFVSLDFEATDHLFRGHPEVYSNYLNHFLNNYRFAKGSHLTKEKFRSKFLEGVSDSSITFLFTHTPARAKMLEQFSPFIKRSRFASQYELNLLFDLVMVINAALKEKIHNVWRYPDLIAELSAKSGYNLNKSDLKGDINLSAQSDFEQTVLDLLNQSYSKSGGSLTRLESDIGISCCIRNHAAHNIAFSQVIWSKFDHLLQSVFNVLFLTVDEYYI